MKGNKQMKTAIKKTLLILSSALLLAGCNPSGDDSSSKDDTQTSLIPSSDGDVTSEKGNSSSDGDKGDSSSSEQKVTKYAIVDRTGDGISISLSATSAPKGETITITVALEENYVLNALYANGKECTKVNDATYTFVMGDNAVAITASLSVTGDVVTSGDVAISLAKQSDGTYKGSFTANSDTKFLILAGGKEYGYGSVDFDRSYAYISSVYESGSKATTKISVGGNATYEIAFDADAEKPISIYRTGILKALESETEISQYFCGWFAGREVLDGGAYNVKSVNHVTYSSSRSKVNYTWDLYQDGSFATAEDKLTGKKSYVYKAIKDGVYTVVDTYVESWTDTAGYVDRTKTQDTVAYSGKYAIVDEVDNSHYQKTSFMANADMAMPSHELHSINAEIQYGYYIGYTVEDELKACDRKFTGVKNADNSFTTTVHSWKNYEDSDAIQTRYEYDITININADGTLSSVSYLENYYTKDNWTFNNLDTTNGGSAIAGKDPEVKNSSSVSYGYGAAKAESISFDATPYFISSIDKVTIKSNSDKSKKEGHVKFKEILDEDRRDPYTKTVSEDSASGYTSTISLEYTPSTALDAWEYGIVSADDSSIIGKSEFRPREWIGYGVGTTEVTIGNHATNNVTKKASVTIDDAPVPNGYYVWAYGNESDEDVPSSSSVCIKAGRIMNVYLWASPADCLAKPVVTCSNDDIKLTVSENTVKPTKSTISTYQAYILTIDASKIATDTKLSETITVVDSRDDSGKKSTIKLEVKPGTASLLPTSIEGTTWTAHDYDSVDNVGATDPRHMEGSFVPAKITFTADYGKEINGTVYKKGKVTVTSSSTDYDFYYNYSVGDSGGMVLSIVSDSYTLDIGASLLEDYGLIGIYVYESSWTGTDESDSNYIIGYPEEEDEAVEYQWFTLDA